MQGSGAAGPSGLQTKNDEAEQAERNAQYVQDDIDQEFSDHVSNEERPREDEPAQSARYRGRSPEVKFRCQGEQPYMQDRHDRTQNPLRKDTGSGLRSGPEPLGQGSRHKRQGQQKARRQVRETEILLGGQEAVHSASLTSAVRTPVYSRSGLKNLPTFSKKVYGSPSTKGTSPV